MKGTHCCPSYHMLTPGSRKLQVGKVNKYVVTKTGSDSATPGFRMPRQSNLCQDTGSLNFPQARLPHQERYPSTELQGLRASRKQQTEESLRGAMDLCERGSLHRSLNIPQPGRERKPRESCVANFSRPPPLDRCARCESPLKHCDDLRRLDGTKCLSVLNPSLQPLILNPTSPNPKP